MRIRRLTVEDLDAVVAIERAVSRIPWSRRAFEEELAEGDRRAWLLAEEDGAVLGYAGALIVLDEAHVVNVAVVPARWGEGIATRLLLELLGMLRARGVRDCTLEVRIGNERAAALYRRLGFAPVGLRRAYYPDTGEDAIIMWLRELASPEVVERWDRVRAGLDAPRGAREGSW